MDSGRTGKLAQEKEEAPQPVEAYERERARLVAALGRTTAGGVIEAIQHVGSTSVPGLDGSGIVDVAVAAWPFPLEAVAEAALAAIGYERLSAAEGTPEHRYRHTTGQSQVLVSEPGSQPWRRAVLLRDYLRSVSEARASWHEARAKVGGLARWFDMALPSASEWWIGQHGFGPVEKVVEELARFKGQWLVAGGWCLALHLGRVARVHHDVDVVVARSDQMALQAHLLEHGWELATPMEGRLEPWPRRMELHLPRHQVHAHRGDEFIDFLLTDLSEGVWRFRREPVVLRGLEKAALRTAAGVPYLAPELALLFKSKNTSKPFQPRPQDEADFERVRPSLDAEQRAWLRWALTVTAPDHGWITRL